MNIKIALRIADCGLRIADSLYQSEIRNPKSAILEVYNAVV